MKVLVDTHSHTVASTHAYSTVHDYFTQAKLKQLQMFSITDHGPEMPDAPHPWHFGNMKVIPRVVDNVAMLRAIEGNILNTQGDLDVLPGMMPYLDFIIASFHEPVFAPSDVATHTQAMVNVIKQGQCQIIGHPGNPNYPIDIEAVLTAAKANNVAVEINNSSFTHSRQGSEANCVAILEMAVRLGTKVSFGSDAHIAYHIGDFHQCIAKAKQVGLPETQIVNRTPESFLAFLHEHGKSVALELADWCQGLSGENHVEET